MLIATGRKPNIEGLDLELAGVEYSPKGIAVDDDFRTNVEGIYAIGDVNGRCMLAHAATFQGLHVVNKILGKEDNIKFDVMPSKSNPKRSMRVMRPLIRWVYELYCVLKPLFLSMTGRSVTGTA